MNQTEPTAILQSQSRAEYISRINRVLDYIEAHLDEELSLQSLAKVANFSPFHFHRIFKAIVGETLNQFIQRLRIERAAGILVGNPNRSITEVALDCGFSSSATFARAVNDFFHNGGFVCKTKINYRRASKSKIFQRWQLPMFVMSVPTREMKSRLKICLIG